LKIQVAHLPLIEVGVFARKEKKINKAIVAGTRYFNDYNLMRTKLDCFLKNLKNVEIVSGAARGADTLGEHYIDDGEKYMGLSVG
jgi:hypothetical protein